MSSRRSLMRTAGLSMAAMGAIPLLAGREAHAKGDDAESHNSKVTDADILNFALNLEYLEAEFYQRAVTGNGLTAVDTTGVGNQGTVVGGSAVPFSSSAIAQYAAEIAADELAHVRFLRTALGSAAVAEPSIDLFNSFNTAASAAGLGDSFNPFSSDVTFLLGSYIFEDVGVTAYNGAAPLIRKKAYLAAAASILGVEAYHAATVRTLLLQMGQGAATAAISALRAAASGAADDQGVLLNGVANITPTDANALVFSRTTTQVLNIVYLGGASGNFGFFPEGLNGAIA
ncbi:MAG: hypothetical protein QOG73_1580 [Acetobacteraceae bacterium]|nr:hypothetical protein [Acetobacteraceae bacterium]